MSAAAEERPATVFTPAKRGDVVIVHETITSWAQRGDSSSFDTVSVGTVTSITREGMVKGWKPARDSQPQKVPSRAKTYLVPQGTVHVPALLAMAATHDMSDLGYPSFYRSLDDVRRDARRCRLAECAAWDAAGAAERFWRASGAAWTAYQAGQRAAGIASRDAGYHTRDGREAHDRITRAAMTAHTRAMLAAAAEFRSAVPK